MEKQNKGGRPFFKDPEDRKTKYITVRVSERELKDFTDFAKHENLKPSEFLRNLVYQTIGISFKKKATESEKQFSKEMRKMAVNLNQLTAKSNSQNLAEKDKIKLSLLLDILLEEMDKL
jgi:Mobilization protein NikA